MRQDAPVDEALHRSCTRYAHDLATEVSRFLIPSASDHVLTSAWLAELFLDAHVTVDGARLSIAGVGLFPKNKETGL